jgi:hypothetical protein
MYHSEYKNLNYAFSMIENDIKEKQDLVIYKYLFKWIDNSFEKTISEIIPFNTKFMGINFVYESPFIERPKYKWSYRPILEEGED